MTATTATARLLLPARFGFSYGETVSVSLAGLTIGIARQHGRSGTIIVGRTADGGLVQIVRSAQTKETQKALAAAIKGLNAPHPSSVGAAVSYAWGR